MMDLKRIRIRGFNDIGPLMKELGLVRLPEFFLVYEAKNGASDVTAVRRRMDAVLQAMQDSVRKGTAQPNVTPSGMICGGAALVDASTGTGSLLGPGFTRVVRNALAVAESNACMGRVVAAPTAGSSGVLPGALLTVGEMRQVGRDRLVDALLVAGGVGEVISIQASLAGAKHGCQAETGAAAAMAAAGIASMFSEDMAVIESAAAFALKNLLGLVCDPVAGRVEIPCVKRNVVAALNAVACAEMALAGIRTVIPLDEVIHAMAEVGNAMPCSLRETSLGGLAAAPTALKIAAALKEEIR